MVGTVTEHLSQITTDMFHYVVITIPSFSLFSTGPHCHFLCVGQCMKKKQVYVLYSFFSSAMGKMQPIQEYRLLKTINMLSIKDGSILMMSVSGFFQNQRACHFLKEGTCTNVRHFVLNKVELGFVICNHEEHLVDQAI